MDAEHVVVGGLLLDVRVGIGGGSLLEGHACLSLVAHVQVGQSHVEVSVLGQGVVVAGGGSPAQQGRHL